MTQHRFTVRGVILGRALNQNVILISSFFYLPLLQKQLLRRAIIDIILPKIHFCPENFPKPDKAPVSAAKQTLLLTWAKSCEASLRRDVEMDSIHTVASGKPSGWIKPIRNWENHILSNTIPMVYIPASFLSFVSQKCCLTAADCRPYFPPLSPSRPT